MTEHYLTYTNHEGTALELSGAPYWLRSLSGIYGMPAQSVLTDVPLKVPAAMYQGTNTRMRNIDATVVVGGGCASDLITNLAALHAHFWPDIRDDELGTLRYVGFNGEDRTTLVTPPEGGEPGGGTWWMANPSRASSVDVTLRFIAPDATWADTTLVTANGAFVGVGAIPVLCTNAGDADAYATINIDPVATQTTDPLITDIYGNDLQLMDTVTPPRDLTLVLNPQRGVLSIELDDGTDWMGKLSSTSRLIKVAPGANNLTFTGGAAGDDGTITVTFYSQYAGHG